MKRIYRCPECGSDRTQSRGKRNKLLRRQCMNCHKWFNVDHSGKTQEKQVDRQKMAIAHLEGVSFRGISRQFGVSTGQAYGEVMTFLRELPHLADVNRIYCERWHDGVALVDGKYIGVNGFEREIPILWMLDYRTHMPVTFRVYPSESIQAYRQMFSSAQGCGYDLNLLVCDDRSSIWTACQEHYPHSHCQLCQKHFLEALDRRLQEEAPGQYKHSEFLRDVKNNLLTCKITKHAFNTRAVKLIKRYQNDDLYAKCLVETSFEQDRLQGYLGFHKTPLTTNMIEGYNSQIEDKVRTMDNFSCMEHARLWVNGFLIYKALTPLTDCRGKFRKLNGRAPIEMAIKQNLNVPTWNDLIACRYSIQR